MYCMQGEDYRAPWALLTIRNALFPILMASAGAIFVLTAFAVYNFWPLQLFQLAIGSCIIIISYLMMRDRYIRFVRLEDNTLLVPYGEIEGEGLIGLNKSFREECAASGGYRFFIAASTGNYGRLVSSRLNLCVSLKNISMAYRVESAEKKTLRERKSFFRSIRSFYSAPDLETQLLYDIETALCFEFREPLQRMDVKGRDAPLKKVYLSVAEPEAFLAELNRRRSQ
jgi:hypothetical protein